MTRATRALPLAALLTPIWLPSGGCGGESLTVGEEAPDDPADQMTNNEQDPTGSGGAAGLGCHREQSGTGATPTIPGETPEYPGGCTADDSFVSELEREWNTAENDWGDLVGTQWEGHVEGGPTMLLVFGADGTTNARFGEAELFAPPTDPNLGWACDPALPDGRGCTNGLREGLLYRAGLADIGPTRVRFALQERQPWDEWCSLQVPVWDPFDDDCAFGLVDHRQTVDYQNCAYLGPDGTECHPVDCGWLHLAAGATCTCNVDGCRATIGELGDLGELAFDLTRSIDGEELEGSYTRSGTDAHRVILRRAD